MKVTYSHKAKNFLVWKLATGREVEVLISNCYTEFPSENAVGYLYYVGHTAYVKRYPQPEKRA